MFFNADNIEFIVKDFFPLFPKRFLCAIAPMHQIINRGLCKLHIL
jgi:hypothetical protein